MSRKGSKNFATYDEIRATLRDATEYTAALVRHEAEAAKAMERDGDPNERQENERLFIRDLKAFVAAARSARDYIGAAARKLKLDAWLEGRLAKPGARELFEFQRLLANQVLHQYSVRLIPKSNQVQYVGAPDSVLIQGWGRLIPNKMIVTGTVGAKYFFDAAGLENDTEKAYDDVSAVFRSEPVIGLAARYVDELQQMLKNAERNGRFDALNPRKVDPGRA
ncbi:MAG: hypothetical protein WBX26_07555 [Candidatus Cybelea sp.]